MSEQEKQRFDLELLEGGDVILDSVRRNGLTALAHAGTYLHLIAAAKRAGEVGYWVQAVKYLDTAREIALTEMREQVSTITWTAPTPERADG